MLLCASTFVWLKPSVPISRSQESHLCFALPSTMSRMLMVLRYLGLFARLVCVAPQLCSTIVPLLLPCPQNNNTIHGMSSWCYMIGIDIVHDYHSDLRLFPICRYYQHWKGKGLETSGITHHSTCCREHDVKSSITTTTTTLLRTDDYNHYIATTNGFQLRTDVYDLFLHDY